MKRGELYRSANPPGADPKRFRVYVIVSRQAVIESRMATVVCAPVHSSYDGLTTQVPVGTAEGLKHESSIHCDELMTIRKAALTQYIGSLSTGKVQELNLALAVALSLDNPTG